MLSEVDLQHCVYGLLELVRERHTGIAPNGKGLGDLWWSASAMLQDLSESILLIIKDHNAEEDHDEVAFADRKIYRGNIVSCNTDSNCVKGQSEV
jgi:hypothetical protein